MWQGAIKDSVMGEVIRSTALLVVGFGITAAGILVIFYG